MIELRIKEARSLVNRLMRTVGHDESEAAIIADHIIDCELRGLHYGGVSRAISIAEKGTVNLTG